MVTEVFHRMDELGTAREPFLFVLDFALREPFVAPLAELDNQQVLFQIHHQQNFHPPDTSSRPFIFTKTPVDFKVYHVAFQQVRNQIKAGNSYLVNLTFPTPVETDLTLEEIFFRSHARYKLLWKDRFVVFSPEIFIRINQKKISSFPMKGTMDASIPGAEQKLLTNHKELAEHHTIVDLIRNDLSMVAKQIQVERFRYVETINTNFSPLLQVSSHISGSLPQGYEKHLGEILYKLLPAGSISGAPKQKTLEIIRESEIIPRGFYTGVMGVFDGKDLDSGVMIRFIEQTPTGKIFKSGGGITSFSEAESEYREMIDKVYVPFT